MMLDLTGAMVEALNHPAVVAKFKALVAEVNATAAADTWMTSKPAAKYVYGTDGKEEAFRKLRERKPDLDAVSVGTGKARAWRRADLDQFVRSRS
jgi:hypothetical protein